MKQKKLTLAILLVLGNQAVLANPNGAQVVQGTASFANPSANVLNVTNSNNAIINWQQFNIDAGQTTNFIQPSSVSSVLNRVMSSNPSRIMGNLNSNGKVFLINQHGILVGEGAHINTNGFFASTLNITDEDYLKGNLKFNGGGLGDFENQGYIHAGEDGNIVLIAPNIENGGVIEVENGNIILAAGKSITITSLENPDLQFEVSSAENTLTNLGQVIAKNGAASLFAGTLRHSGSIRASGLVQNADGSISLVATDRVEVSGSVDVSGDEAGAQGGSIQILGDVVEIQDGASVNASGAAGGGEILIGGDQQGLNPAVQNATSTTIASTAQVQADATDNGDGGKVIVFAKNDVHVHGAVTARGGENGGDGGFIETSGLKNLDITEAPDASAPNGQGGDWLIDPNNITIQAVGPDANIDDDGYGGPPYSSNDDGAILTTATIVAALEGGSNVIISTTDSDFDFSSGGVGTEVGNINVIDPVSANTSSGVTLELNAHNDINIDADISGTGFGFDLTLNADSDFSTAGQINLNANISGVVGNVVSIDSTDTFNIAGPSVLDPGLTLNLNNGSITNAQNLTFSGILNTSGGTISGNGDTVISSAVNFTYDFSSTGLLIETSSGDLTLDGAVNLIDDFNGYGGANVDFDAANDLFINDDIMDSSSFGLALTFSALNQITFTNSSLDTQGEAITLTGSQVLMTGNVNIAGSSFPAQQINLNAPLEVSGTLSLGRFGAEEFEFNTSPVTITSSGRIVLDSGCGDGCGHAIFNSNVTNNGILEITEGWISIDATFDNNATLLVDFPSDPFDSQAGQIVVGGNASPGLLNLNPGTVISNPGVVDALFNIETIGELNVLTPTIFPANMFLELNEGVISNAQNLTIPNNFYWSGGKIKGNGDFFTPAGSMIDIFGADNAGGEVTLEGTVSNPLTWVNQGTVTWNGGGAYSGMIINDAGIVNQNQFYISASDSFNGNGFIMNDVGAFFGLGSGVVADINTAFFNDGILSVSSASDTLNLSGDLTLANGALLMGEGVLNLNSGLGTLTLDNGGGISPGNNAVGGLAIEGDLVVNPGANLIFDIESNILYDGILVAPDPISFNGGDVTINGGELFVLWEGPAGSNGFDTIADSTVFPFLVCLNPSCMTPVLPFDFKVHDPLNVTGSSAALTLIPDTLNFTLGTKSGTINQWVGGNSDNWNDPFNWSDGVPVSGEVVIIDGNGSNIPAVILDTDVTLNGLQSDVQLVLNSASTLTLNGESVIALTYNQGDGYTGLDVNNPGAVISGSGTLNTLSGSYNHYHSGQNVNLDDWNNYGLICLEDDPVLVFDGNIDGAFFNNHGTFRFMQTNSASVQLVNGGVFNNSGLIVANPNASDVTLTLSSHAPGAEIRVEQGTLFIDQDLSADGLFDVLNGAILSMTNGTTLTMQSGSGFVGEGEVLVPVNTAMDFNAGSLPFDSAMSLTLAGGTLNSTENLAVPDLVNLFFGTVNGSSLDTPFSSTLNLAGPGLTLALHGFSTFNSADIFWQGGTITGTGSMLTGGGSTTELGVSGSVTLDGIDWTNDGHVDWVSADDFIINNATFTNSRLALVTFDVKTTSDEADIVGTGTFNNEGSFNIDSTAGSSNLNIHALFNNRNDGILGNYEGFISVEKGNYELVFHADTIIEGDIDGTTVVDEYVVFAAGNHSLNDQSDDALSLFRGIDVFIDAAAVVSVDNILDMSPYTNILQLNGGTIENAHNLLLPETFNINGGTISGAGTWITRSVPGGTVNIGGGSPFVLDGLGDRFDWIVNKDIFWNAATANTDIALNNGGRLIINGLFDLDNLVPGAQIMGSNGGRFVIGAEGVLVHNISEHLDINVATNAQGSLFVGLDNPGASLSITGGNGLELYNGGTLHGFGTYVGDVLVSSGGMIEPGEPSYWQDGIATLTVDGDVTFDPGSTAIFKMDATAPGVFDQLNVTGSVLMNSPDLLTVWDNVTSLAPQLPPAPYSFISATGGVSGNFNTVIDAVGIPLATTSVLANSVTYDFSAASFDNFWTGLGIDDDWSSAGNWDQGVPLAGQTLVIDDAVLVQLTSTTADLLDVQNSAEIFEILASGNLVVSGELVNTRGTIMDFNDNTSMISGLGTWRNYGNSQINADIMTLGAPGLDIQNHGVINWLPPGPSNTSLTVDSPVDNFGAFKVRNFASWPNDLALAGGLSNSGSFVSFVPNDIQVSGTLTNETSGIIIVTSGDMQLVDSNSSDGQILIRQGGSFEDGSFSFGLTAPATFTLGGNSEVLGGGIFFIDSNGTLDVTVPTEFRALYSNTLTLGLDNGIINNAHNLSIPDRFNIMGGTLNGPGTLLVPFITNTEIYIGGADPLVLNDLILDSGADIYWNGSAATSGIELNNSSLIVRDHFEINNPLGDSGITCTICSSELVIAPDSYFTQFSDSSTVIDVPMTVRGNVQLFDYSGGITINSDGLGTLTLQDGGRLEGFGTLTGNVVAESGGGISPGEAGSFTETLDITGNLDLNPNSVAVFDIHNTGEGWSNDTVQVTGDVNINGGNLYVLWNDYYDGDNSLAAGEIFDFIDSTGGVTIGSFTNIIHPLTVTDASDSILSATTFEYVINSVDGVAAVVYWDGEASNGLWSDPLNWYEQGTGNDVIPGPGDYVILENDLITLSSLEPGSGAFAGLQQSAYLIMDTGAQLAIDGDFINSSYDLFLNGDVTISGAGTWHNLGFAAAEGSNTTYSISNIENFATMTWGQLSTSAATLNVSSIVNNWGTQLVYAPSPVSNSIDYSGGMTNYGLVDIHTGPDLQVDGSFTNETSGELIISAGNVVFNDTAILDGTVDMNNGSQIVLPGGTHTIKSGALFNGSLTVSGGTLDIEGALMLDTLDLSGGTVNVDTLGFGSDLTIASAFNWTGSSTINGGGTGGLVNQTFALVSGSGQFYTVNDLVIDNQGDWNIDSNVNNALRLNNSIFDNNGVFTLLNTAGINPSTGTGVFNNLPGSVFVVNGAGTSNLTDTVFNSVDSTVDIVAGDLQLDAGGTFSGSTDQPNGAMILNLGTFTVLSGADFTSNNALTMTGGTLDIEDALMLDTLDLSGGTVNVDTLGFGSDLTIASAFNWTGSSTINGGGTGGLVNEIFAFALVSGSGQFYTVNDLVIDNQGDWNIDSNVNNALRLNNSIFDNNGVFTLLNTAGINPSTGTGVFNNLPGSVFVVNGAGTSNLIDTVFNSTDSIVDIVAGDLQLDAGGTFSGSTDQPNGAMILNLGTFTVLSGADFTSNNALTMTGGTLDIEDALMLDTLDLSGGTVNVDTLGFGSDLTIASAFNWTGSSTINGGGTGGLVNEIFAFALVSGSGQFYTVNDLVIDNQGDWNIDSNVNNALRLNNSIFDNNGVFTLLNTAGINPSTGTGVFNNLPGSVFVVNGAGTSNLIDTVFNSTDSIVDIVAGDLQLDAGGTFSGSTDQPNGAMILNLGTFTVLSGADFTTNNALTMTGGTLDIEDALMLDTLDLSGGTVNVDTLGFGSDLTIASAFNWTGSSTINGGGTGGLVNEIFAFALVSGSGQFYTVNELVIDNQGDWNIDSNVNNALRLNNSIFDNNGVFTLLNTAGINPSTGTGVFNNLPGSVFVVNGAGTSNLIDTVFNSTDSIVDIVAGDLQLDAGGTFSGSTDQPNGAMILNLGTFTVLSGADFTSNNALTMTGGTLDIEDALMLDTLDLSGGTVNVDTLGFGSDLTIASAFNWTGSSTINGGGTGGLVNEIFAFALVSGSGQFYTVNDLVIDNQGDWNIDSNVNNALRLNNSIFDNNGVFTLLNTAGINPSTGTGVFNNLPGSVFVVNGAGTSNLTDTVFNSVDSTVDIVAGDLQLDAGGNFGNTELILDSGDLILNAGNFVHTGDIMLPTALDILTIGGTSFVSQAGASFSGSGEVLVPTGQSWSIQGVTSMASTNILVLDGGMIGSAENLLPGNTFYWNSGTVAGTDGENFVLPAGTATSLAGGAITLDMVNLINQGDIVWSGAGGSIAIDNGAVWNNTSQMTLQNTSQLDITTNSPVNSGMTNLDNATLLVDSPSVVDISAPFTNYAPGFADSGATIDIQQGTLTLATPLVLDEGASLLGNGELDASLIVNNASVYPGNSVGVLNVSGDVVFNAGSELVIELDNGSSDVLDVGGTVSINSAAAMSIATVNGYNGTYLEGFTPIVSTGLSGIFDNLNQAADFKVSPTYGATTLDLIVSSLLNSWNGGGSDGLWSTAANWSRSESPGAGHETFITDGFSTVIHAAGDDTILSLITNSGTALDIEGGSLTLEALSVIDGQLNISNATLSTNSDLTVQTLTLSNASLNGGTADLTVIDPLTLDNSSINNWNNLIAPQFDVTGTSSIESISYIAHDGALDITGSGDTLNLVNSQLYTEVGGTITGLGRLQISTASQWQLNAPVLMPMAMTLSLSDGAILNAGNLVVPATFEWTNGAISDAAGVNFILPVGTSTQLGAGSITLDTLNLINQGDIVWSGAGGSIAIDNGAVWNNVGQMTLQNTSQLDITSNSPGNSGMTNLDNATLLIDSTSNVVISAPFTNHAPGTTDSGATIDIQQGTLTLATPLVLDEGASLLGNGILDSSLVVNNGSVHPGNSVGTLSVSGDVNFNAGSELVVELDNGSSDVLDVGGTVSINSAAAMSIATANGYNGTYLEGFSPIVSTGLSGTFDTLNQAADFKVSPTYGTTTLDLIVSSLLNSWTGAGEDGLWSTAANWSRSESPGAGHETFITDGFSTVIHAAGDDTILGLITNSGTALDIEGGSLTLEALSVIDGQLNVSNATLSTNSDLTVQTLTLSNALLNGGAANLTVIDPLTLDNSSINNWNDLMLPRLNVTGTSTLESIGYVAHDGVIEVTAVTDKLVLSNSMMDSTGTASMTGAGIMDLQTGSDWAINTTESMVMPVAMTLDLNDGVLRNVEKLVFPGTVNANLINFQQNGSLLIPSTTTFNYFVNNDIPPSFDIVNDGVFVIQNAASSMNLNAQNSALFINNGTFRIDSATTLNLLTDLQNNGLMSLSAGSEVAVLTGATLFQAGSMAGNGVVSANGGVIDFTAPSSLPDTLILKLLSGSFVNAQNLTVAGQFDWTAGTIVGTGSGFNTAGPVNVQNGVLNTVWNANGITDLSGDLGGSGNMIIPVGAQLTSTDNVISVVTTLDGGTLTANTLELIDTFNWIAGTVDGTGLATTALASVQTGVLDSSWDARGTTNISADMTGTGSINIPVGAVLTSTDNVIALNVMLDGGTLTANNLELSSTFDWMDGSVAGTQLVTSGQVNLTRGILDADWIISPTGIVDWVGSDRDQLEISNATITNQGTFNVTSNMLSEEFVSSPVDNLAFKDFSSSSNGSFINEGLLFINGDDDVDFNLIAFDNVGGTIVIQSGATFISSLLTLDAGESLQGFGTFIGNVDNIAGLVSPGLTGVSGFADEIGSLNITGNFIQSAQGILGFEIDALGYDQLNVSGNLNAAGSVVFTAINNATTEQVNALIASGFTPLQVTGNRVVSFQVASNDFGIMIGADGQLTREDGTVVEEAVAQGSNELEVLFSKESLNYEEFVEVIKLVDKKVKLDLPDDDEDDDEEDQAPRLVCK